MTLPLILLTTVPAKVITAPGDTLRAALATGKTAQSDSVTR